MRQCLEYILSLCDRVANRQQNIGLPVLLGRVSGHRQQPNPDQQPFIEHDADQNSDTDSDHTPLGNLWESERDGVSPGATSPHTLLNSYPRQVVEDHSSDSDANPQNYNSSSEQSSSSCFLCSFACFRQLFRCIAS